ncbi:MAG: FAD-dependent oxidoreductase [Pseudomonadota bacterium]
MTSSSTSFDVAVLGGGVFGLWIARRCAAVGLTTALVDKAKPGSGASGGPLGALMPHVPDRWNAKKQFQFEALTTLATEIADLESETGLATGYRRTGRLMPIRTAGFLRQSAERQEDSRSRWTAHDPDLVFAVESAVDPAGWLAEAATPLGHVRETLAARVQPRALCRALAASVARTCSVFDGFEVGAIDGQSGRVLATDGRQSINAGTIVLTTGYQSFGLLDQITGLALGKGVKGQAVLLDTREDPAHPIVYDDGTYVIVHDDGRTAIGSTSENVWTSASVPDPSNRAFLDRAFALVPALAGTPIVEWWAGVRPKCIERDPMIGFLPDTPRIMVATGGFKISFGIAHKVADSVMALLDGVDPDLPETFRAEHHFTRAMARTDRDEADEFAATAQTAKPHP